MNYDKYVAAGAALGSYDSPMWIVGDKLKEHYCLFRWMVLNSEIPALIGTLIEEQFDTIEKKIAYVKGVMKGPGIPGLDRLSFANSSITVERVKKWLFEIHYLLFRKTNTVKFHSCAVTRHSIEYHTPICHELSIAPGLLDFVKNYKLE